MALTHVLLTRPQPQCDALGDRLQAIGLAPIIMPAYRFEGRSYTPDREVGWAEARARLLLFTSPRAVRYGLPRLPATQRPATHIAAIGPATAAALRAAGHSALAPLAPPYNSETLLARLEPMLTSAVAPRAAQILTAPKGRAALLAGLRARGWATAQVPVYERILLAPTEEAGAVLRAASAVASVWTSATAMQHLCAVLPADALAGLRAGPALVASARLAETAREHGFGSVLQTAGADNETLFAALRQQLKA